MSLHTPGGKSFFLVASAAVFFLLVLKSHSETAPEEYVRPAQFRVTDAVVNPQLEPFAATISGIGNGLISEGFEPMIYRNRFIASENAPDRFIAPAALITHYDTLREGFLDEAEVHVYRIEMGRIRMVRKGRIAQGGFHASGWMPQVQDGQVVPPGKTRYTFRWSDYNRPDVQYFFAVRAIDSSGNLSSPSLALPVGRPKDVSDRGPASTTVEFRRSGLKNDDTPPPVPQNLRGRIGESGALELEWDPVDAGDLAGYLVYRSDYPAREIRGYHFDFASPAASPDQRIRAGDLAVVSKKLYSASRNRHLSNRVWGAWNEYRILLPGLVDFFSDESYRRAWELVAHTRDAAVEEPGETFMRVRLAAGEKVSLGAYNHSGTAQFWYPVLEARPYRLEFWMRADSGEKVRFRASNRCDPSVPPIEPIDFTVGREWKKYSATFTPAAVQRSECPNRMALEIAGKGTYDIDNFRIYQVDRGFMELPERDYLELKRSGMQALRTHGIVNTRFRTHDMAQLTNLPGITGGGTQQHNTLPQLLHVMRRAGMQPWLQLEWHMSPDEWLALVEYLAAPYDPHRDTPQTKPWAYKRYSQGQARPWTEEFGRIYFELSNETWNRLFYPWVFDAMTDAADGRKYSPGQVYGLYQEYVRSILRSSSYWQAAGLDEKFRFVLGGWARQDYGREAAASSPSSDYLAIAAYNGGWDEKEGPPEANPKGFFNVLAKAGQLAASTARRHAGEVEELRAKGLGGLKLATYEAGPGYALQGLNNAVVSKRQEQEQERVMKSLAAGTATLDTFLARAHLGFSLQNFFTFDRGTHWKSHAKSYSGGQAYPSWKLLSLFNNEATGDMLRTETIGVPVASMQGFSLGHAAADAPLAAVYATRKDDRYNVFVLSRKISGYPVAGDEGFTPVSIDLPFRRAKRITLYRMTGNPMANNLAGDEVKIEKMDLPADGFNGSLTMSEENGADKRGLPPASTYLYVFEGAGR